MSATCWGPRQGVTPAPRARARLAKNRLPSSAVTFCAPSGSSSTHALLLLLEATCRPGPTTTSSIAPFSLSRPSPSQPHCVVLCQGPDGHERREKCVLRRERFSSEARSSAPSANKRKTLDFFFFKREGGKEEQRVGGREEQRERDA